MKKRVEQKSLQFSLRALLLHIFFLNAIVSLNLIGNVGLWWKRPTPPYTKGRKPSDVGFSRTGYGFPIISVVVIKGREKNIVDQIYVIPIILNCLFVALAHLLLIIIFRRIAPTQPNIKSPKFDRKPLQNKQPNAPSPDDPKNSNMGNQAGGQGAI